MKLAMKVEPNHEKLSAILKAGYEAVEVYLARRFITPEYIELLLSYPFHYSVHAPVQYCDDSVFDLAQAVNAKTVTVHCTYTLDELEYLALRATNFGLNLCIENEGVWGEDNYEQDLKKPPELMTVHTGEDFLRLKEKIPDLYLTLDTEHAGMRDSLDSFWPLVKKGFVLHSHTSGYDKTRGSWHSPPLNNEPAFRENIARLKELNYQHFLTVEMHMKHHTLEHFAAHQKVYKSC